MAVPKLSLDRPFTYLLPDEADAGVGSLVSVPFHGRTIKAWILGPATEPPSARLLTIRKVRSPVRFFDREMLSLFRWVSERYIAPLSVVIERSHPPRVVSEEPSEQRGAAPTSTPRMAGGTSLTPGTTTWLRPLPGREAVECVDAVRACLDAGRRAIVVVPEAAPLPFTARVVLEEVGGRAVNFVGGDARVRYGTWLDILHGRYDLVVGTRPAVFAPLVELGLIWISREVHPGHREERIPYYHVRDVAMARARLHDAACVLASYSPSVETAVAMEAGDVLLRRPSRVDERAHAPLVETTAPEAEDRSGRLARLLKTARSAALIVSRRGYGVARICRSCGEAAACATCRGAIVVERGAPACAVCGAPGRCRNCGADQFGVERGGAERVAEWARRIAPVEVISAADGVTAPGPGRVLVGTASAVNDVGPLALDLVAILDPDRALSWAGVHAGERAVATWMEAAAWAGPRTGEGRVLAQTRRPGHPAIQALVRWDPDPFLRSEAASREAGGFPAGHPVFRVEGGPALKAALEEIHPVTLLTTSAEGRTVCLVTVRLVGLAELRNRVLELVRDGTVTRVEADPQL